MKKILLLAISLLLIFQKAICQPVYDINNQLEFSLISTGVVMLLGSKLAEKATPPSFVADEVATLDPTKICWAFDRRATKNWSEGANDASNLLLYGPLAFQTMFLLLDRDLDNMPFVFGESLLLTAGLTKLVKTLAHRTRPFAYNPDAPLSEKLRLDARRSFFSGHTALSATGCFVLAKTFSDHYPDKNFPKYLWAGAAVIPALTGWQRVRAGKHFPTDVLAGYAVGALVGWGVPELHRRAAKTKFEKRGGHGATFLLGGATLFGLTIHF